jgi:ABC-type cobalt transport system substrate-binding protein
MRLFDASIIILLSILVIVYTIGVLSSEYLGDDNTVEEAAEEVIKATTGQDVDLS